MKTATRSIFLVSLATLLFTACVKGPEGNGRKVKGAGPVRIGFSKTL